MNVKKDVMGAAYGHVVDATAWRVRVAVYRPVREAVYLGVEDAVQWSVHDAVWGEVNKL